MKNKIIVLLLLMSVSVNAQLKKFQGFWMSGDTSYNTVITHNDEKDSLKIYTFSFTKNDKLIQNITKINKETFESRQKNKLFTAVEKIETDTPDLIYPLFSLTLDIAQYSDLSVVFGIL